MATAPLSPEEMGHAESTELKPGGGRYRVVGPGVDDVFDEDGARQFVMDDPKGSSANVPKPGFTIEELEKPDWLTEHEENEAAEAEEKAYRAAEGARTAQLTAEITACAKRAGRILAQCEVSRILWEVRDGGRTVEECIAEVPERRRKEASRYHVTGPDGDHDCYAEDVPHLTMKDGQTCPGYHAEPLGKPDWLKDVEAREAEAKREAKHAAEAQAPQQKQRRPRVKCPSCGYHVLVEEFADGSGRLFIFAHQDRFGKGPCRGGGEEVNPSDIEREDGSGSGRELTLTPASAIKARAVRWTWQDRIPAGMLTLLAGREGEGKSTNAYEIVARITRGELPGEHKGEPRAVIVLATEDSWEHTIVPRLLAAKADLDLVFRAAVKGLADLALQLPDDLPGLEKSIEAKGAALVLLDPVISRLSSKLDTHKDSEVRQALEPLVAMADRKGCALVGLIHVNKTATTDPLTAVMGSRAFAAVARAVLFVTRDASDRRLLCLAKCNLGPEQPSIVFTIDAAKVGEEEDTGKPITGSFVRWGEEVTTTARQALESKTHVETPRDRAEAWLLKRLEAGPVLSAELKREAVAAGFSVKTIERARRDLGLKVSTRGKETLWETEL